MPSEWCRVCNNERGSNALSARSSRGQHHGTGCRYSRCVEHCSCTRELQEDWRTTLRLMGSGGLRFRCTSCGNSSAHVCVQHNELNGEQRSTNGRFCGICCREPACIENAPCETRLHAELFVCQSCSTRQSVEVELTQAQALLFDIRNAPTMRLCRRCYVSACNTCGAHVATPERLCRQCHRCAVPSEAYDPDGELVEQDDDGLQWHCRCHAELERPTLLRVDSVSFLHVDRAKPTKQGPVMRAMGVELEICGFRKPKRKALEGLYNTCAKWNTAIGTDGSLPENGVEIRTSPAAGNLFYRQLGEVMIAIKGANGFVNEQAGLHVHVDCRDYAAHLARLDKPEFHAAGFFMPLDIACYFYMLCEPVFYGMADETRQTNRFARSWEAMNVNTANWRVNASTHAALRGWYYMVSRSVTRYAGMNVAAFSAHKTLEFRLHHGCLNRRMVTAYALICGAFIDKCFTMKDPIKLRDYIVKHGPMEFMQRIAPTEDARKYLTWRADRAKRKAA